MSQYFSNNTNTSNTINVSNNFTIADDRSGILAWLSPQDPKLRHQDIRERRVEGVGEWLMQTEEFRSWCAGCGGGESGNAVLFCYGDPGVGKTFISSLVIDRLCDRARGRNATVACCYFDFAIKKEQSSMSMLRSLLKQLVSGLEETPEEISQAFQDQKSAIGGREPAPSDFVKMLQNTCSKKPTFICIDALDECAAAHRVKLLGSPGKILQKSPGTRVFVTGRPHIRPEIGRRFSGKATSVSITSQRDDIISYLHHKLDEDTNPDAMDGSLEADILRRIPEDISEIFLLVSLNIDAILQEPTISRRRQKLGAMTDGSGLGDAYSATLGRIKGEGGERSRLGIAALMWISHSERPLKVDELCHALAVQIGSSSLDSDNVPSIGTLIACCQGLIAVDKEASTVRLIHFTLQEYLRAHPQLFGKAHSTIAETCLSYLNSQQVNALSTGPSPPLQDTPFLEYSSVYWGAHAKRELSDCSKMLALKLFDGHNSHISTKTLLGAQDLYRYYVDLDKISGFSGLHCASFFGIVEIVASLVEVEGCDINQKDFMGNTPLLWAAKNGHEKVVKMLLARGDASAGEAGNYGQTPLLCASLRGQEEVVKMLLRRDDVNPDMPDMYGQTPIYCAAENGHQEVVKILLTRGNVNPDKPDNYGRTPLSWAAMNGHEGVVKILLGQDEVNSDKPDNYGQTQLSWAALNGHEGVVKILLARDEVDPDRPDNCGRAPLSWAAWNGHEGVVKMLLRRCDIDPNKPDKCGRTPLWWAAATGNAGVVKILLGRDAVNPNKPDYDSRTPLSCAAENGHEGVVKILLERDDVNPGKTDNDGQTPIWWAASRGHAGVIAILQPAVSSSPTRSKSRRGIPLPFWVRVT